MNKLIKKISAIILSLTVLFSMNLQSFAQTTVTFDNESGNPIKFTAYAICRLGSSAEQDSFKIEDIYYSEKEDLDLKDCWSVNYRNKMYNGKEVATIYGKSEKAYVIYMFSFAGPTGYYFFDDLEYYKSISPFVYHYSSTGFEPYELYQWVKDITTYKMIEDTYIYQRTYLSDKNQKIRLYTFANYIEDDEIYDVYDAYTEWALANEEQINPKEFNLESELTTEPTSEPIVEPVIEEPIKEPEMVVVTPAPIKTETITEPEPVIKEESNTSWMIWVFGAIFIGICAFTIIKFKKE